MKPNNRWIAAMLAVVTLSAHVHAQGVGLDSLYRLKDSKTRSISPENFTGEKGKGGMATLDEGSAARAARELGQGWKVNPYVRIEPGTTFTLGEIDGSGVINHIWMTPVGDYRLMILRFYWDDETEPSVEVPAGDFFAAGWGMGNEPRITSLAVCVNPRSGFNSYWQMPFRKGCKVTMENLGDKTATVYYQIDYTLERVPKNTPYFHAQFRRVNPLPYKDVYTIVDGIRGRGQYVGTYLAHGANSEGWWGEGEIKFFIDGDGEFPTICGTGEEDYFCGSYGYNERVENGVYSYDSFTSPYTGFHHIPYEGIQRRFGQYRWHITDPVRFDHDLRITIQSLGWQSEGRYLPLQDDLASVAYWYQIEPHNPFPPLPSKENLVIQAALPLRGFLRRNIFAEETTVTIESPEGVQEVRYTMDGSEPGPNSTKYTGPIRIAESCSIMAQGFTSGKRVTPVLKGEFVRQTARKTTKLSSPKPGVKYAMFVLEETLESVKALDGRTPTKEDIAPKLGFPSEDMPDRFGLIMTGYINIPEKGIYTFTTTSNDGSRLQIGDQILVDNDGQHGSIERSGQIALDAGYHPIRLEYFQAGGGRDLEVTIQGPGTLFKQPIPAAMLVH